MAVGISSKESANSSILYDGWLKNTFEICQKDI